MGNMQRNRRTGVHPVVPRTAQLVIAAYATAAKPSVAMPGRYIANFNDVEIRVESATGNLRGYLDATSTLNAAVVEIRSVRGEQVAASIGNHTQAQVAGALADHTQAQVAGALADHPVHQHDITTVVAAGGGSALTEPVIAGPFESAGGGQVNPNAVDANAAAQAHAAGAAALAHAAGAAALAHATIANAYAEDREIADQALAATITVTAPMVV